MKLIRWILVVMLVALSFNAARVLAQQPASPPARTESQETNIRAYIELLRADVKAKKTAIFTDSGFQEKGKSETGATLRKTAGGAGLGAAIGAISGNAGEGAAIGATAGLGCP
jgi:hypothetical protein